MAVKDIQADHLGGIAKMPRGKQRSTDPMPGKLASGHSWKLEDAKAKFSEVVRRAHSEGPQYVTVRGKPAVAIINAAELERLLPASEPRIPFVAFMESLHVEGLDLTREQDTGREVQLSSAG